MSKYNNVKSIPIDSLSSEELSNAIEEWSEGNNNMEELLWNFHNKGIKTNGSHVGTNSYIGIEYEIDKKDAISKITNFILSVRGIEVLIIPDGGNPYSGPDWYKPIITIISKTWIENVANNHFKVVTNILNDNSEIIKEINSKPMFELLDFFINKYIGLYFRILHDNDDNYSISFEVSTEENSDLYIYLNNNLLNLGFNIRGVEGGNHKFWEFSTKNSKELNIKIKNAVNNLIKNYSFRTPINLEEVDLLEDSLANPYIARIHLLREKSIDEFKQYLENERKKSSWI